MSVDIASGNLVAPDALAAALAAIIRAEVRAEVAATSVPAKTRLLDMDTVHKRVSLSKPTLYGLVRDGQLPAVRINGRLLIRETDLADFIVARRVAGKRT